MSVYWEAQVWATEALSGLDKFVVLAMARAAGEDGLTFLSVKTLAAQTGVGVTKAGLALKVAEDRGILVRPPADETSHLTGYRAVIYRFQAEAMSPPRGDHSPGDGDHSPRGGYIWQPDGASEISPRLRVAESGLRVAESGLRVAGTTSTSRDADEDQQPVMENHPPRSSSLLKYWLAEFQKAVRVHEPTVIGSVNERALGRLLKLLVTRDKLTRDQIVAMINAYMAQPSAWNKNTHPSLDFCSSGTLTRLRNQSKHRDVVGIIPPPSALTEVMAELTVEEQIAQIQAEDRGRFKWATK